MTTFDGKPFSFVPGKEAPNREPPVSKHVVEKLYQVHRERVLKVEPLIDSHVHIPDFLTNTAWKLSAEEHRRNVIARDNEVIYKRIAKRAAETSNITKDAQDHIRRVNDIKYHTKRLKEAGRVRQVMVIQKENEMMLQRIDRARAEYTVKSIEEWYKHHTRFKEGRRSDPTAGHIMKTVSKKVLPKPLPNLDRSNFELAVDAGKGRLKSKNGSMYTALSSQNSSRAFTAPSKHRMHDKGSPISRNVNTLASVLSDSDFFNIQETKLDDVKMKNKRPKTSEKLSRQKMNTLSISPNALETTGTVINDDFSYPTELVKIELGSSEVQEVSHKDFILLTQRNVQLPNDIQFFVVEVLVKEASNPINEFVFRLRSSSLHNQILQERILSYEEVKEIVKIAGLHAHLIHKNEDEGLDDLRNLLIRLFKESDLDNSGFLAFDEFENLLAKNEIGLSGNELRFVIAEADNNGNGVVEFEEFIPLAIDLIQAFRARTSALVWLSEAESCYSEEMKRIINEKDIQAVSEIVTQRLNEMDKHGTKLARYYEIHKALLSVPRKYNLDEELIAVIIRHLPVDVHGHYLYSNLEGAILQAMCDILRRQLMFNHGSSIYKHLIEVCCALEKQNINSKETGNDHLNSILTGYLPYRELITLISTDKKLKISRILVLVISSYCETITSNNSINYFNVCSMAAKTIEIVYSTIMLKQRAQVLTSLDFSIDCLITADSEERDHKLRELFKIYDMDKNLELDEIEFNRTLCSLDIELNEDEMKALFVSASGKNNTIFIDNFLQFFNNHLVRLEKERRFKILKAKLHNKKQVFQFRQHALEEINVSECIKHLAKIFRYADETNSGLLDYEYIVKLLLKLELRVTEFDIHTFLENLEVNSNGKVPYEKVIFICRDLFTMFVTREVSLKIRTDMEIKAHFLAEKIMNSTLDQIVILAKFLHQKIRVIESICHTQNERMEEFKVVLKGARLPKSEINFLTKHLFTDSKSHAITKYHIEENTNDPQPIPQAKKTSGRRSSIAYTKEKRNKVSLSEAELIDILIITRKTTLMKQFLDEVDVDTVADELTVCADNLAQTLRSQRVMSLFDDFMPVNNCFEFIEEARSEVNTRSHILSVLCWCEYYNDNHTMIDYKKLIPYAANIFCKFAEGSLLAKRADILEPHIDDASYMKGLTFDECEKYLHYSMKDKIVDHMMLIDDIIPILSDVPKLRLTKMEVMAIVSTIRRDEQRMFHAEEFIEHAYSICHAICSERLMTTDMMRSDVNSSLGTFNSHNPSYTLHSKQKLKEKLRCKDIAIKCLDMVTLKKMADTVLLVFPNDRKGENLIHLSTDLQPDSRQSQIKALLDGGVELFKLPMVIKIVDTEKDSSDNTKVVQKIPSLVRVTAYYKDGIETEGFKRVELHIVGINNDIDCNVTLPVHLSSLASVDKTTTCLFVSNFLDKFYLERYSSGINIKYNVVLTDESM